ncbi:MAG: hypothetical protein Q8O55_04185 [Dehalococcoidales bacterium]|nr:hypothetical protein [Dehalococcoidales bacterium]
MEIATLWVALGLGLLLGLRHALDADHMVAVTTIVSEYRNSLKGIWIGISWGLGHTTTLLLVGLTFLLFKLALPQRLALGFELAVGFLLIALGIQVLWGIRKKRLHWHAHAHSQEAHHHLHAHQEGASEGQRRRFTWSSIAYFLVAGISPGEHHPGGTFAEGLRPFFRLKSYLVGIVHGLAGSAALMLLVLASIETTWAGVLYILVFGVGSIAAMGVITLLMSTPFVISARFTLLNYLVHGAAGIASLSLGSFLIYEIVFVEGFFSL